MSMMQSEFNRNLRHREAATRQQGFTLVELMVALGMFLVIGAAAFHLVQNHQKLFNTQQNQAGLNMALRTAVAQMQIDVVNAGAGFGAARVQPIGITIANSNAAGCTGANFTYTATCFDALNVISADPTVAAMGTDQTGGGNCGAANTADTDTTQQDFYITLPTAATTPPTAAQLTALAASFKNGDQVLFVQTDGSSHVIGLTTAILTADGTAAAKSVKLKHRATNPDGTNLPVNDPMGISINLIGPTASVPPTTSGTQFCGGASWVFRLLPQTTFYVDATDGTNPKLMRRAGAANPEVIAEQVVGFKVGESDNNDPEYKFQGPQYQFSWPDIRSVRISIIGRTVPNSDNPGKNSTNTFDGGPYKIDTVSVVIYPRNLSNYDF
ncbi:MAG TPA: prepilin-type N-terminal cleavage/methylation domain-containing protein [Alphaproteobacteria bacterium]|nr:prepilin-type N-terminal cleavage/methylation domain-containing protein [Alphaproteobacteria bacterium]